MRRGGTTPVLDDLLAGATSRESWFPEDTKSGARFERLVIDGEPMVLKYQDARDDWLMRATGDTGDRYVRLFESGLLARMPDVIDHAVVAVAFDGGVGRISCETCPVSCSLPAHPSRPTSTSSSSTTWPLCTRRSGIGTTMWA
jgi:hypothetical protein